MLGLCYLAPAITGLMTIPAVGIITYAAIHTLMIGACMFEKRTGGNVDYLLPRTAALKATVS